MSQAAIDWWNNSLNEMGIQGMEKLVHRDAGWDALLKSGRDDLARGLLLTNMTLGKDRKALDIGCGVGRMSQALGRHFGHVLGVDVADSLIKEANARNTHPHIAFGVLDGETLLPGVIGEFDTVFSYEVLYLLPPELLRKYFHDVRRVLKRGGEFVFQINCQPMTWKTRLSYRFRDLLAAVGVKKFRGWPTGAGFRRFEHLQGRVAAMLTNAGFFVERIADHGTGPKQTWFVARRFDDALLETNVP